jgi:LysR family transcriptional regulator, regulator for bpeEF and oprC
MWTWQSCSSCRPISRGKLLRQTGPRARSFLKDARVDYLTAVRTFVRVVEAGSFSKAADSLELPRNTVTKLVQSLEAHLRVKLLNRTTRQVSTTSDGEIYFDRMVRLLEDWYEAESELSSGQQNPHGRLRVDMGAGMASQLIIPALADFRERYPEIQLDIGVSDRPLDLVSERIDCVIRAGDIKDPSLIARHMGDMPFVICAAPSYLAMHGTPQVPQDLSTSHTMVRYFYSGSTRQLPFILTSDAGTVSVEGKYFVSVNESNALLAAAVAGLGVTAGPAFMLQPKVESGELMAILPSWSPPAVPLHVVFPANRHMNVRTRVFVDWMIDLCRNSRHILPPRTVDAARRGNTA